MACIRVVDMLALGADALQPRQSGPIHKTKEHVSDVSLALAESPPHWTHFLPTVEVQTFPSGRDRSCSNHAQLRHAAARGHEPAYASQGDLKGRQFPTAYAGQQTHGGLLIQRSKVSMCMHAGGHLQVNQNGRSCCLGQTPTS